ncbi:hypothetical protein J1605_001534 [Eschrichtius robustus]|uniref:Uncharacterized protein n=1 Tax=Eschrichtius robustus TaxID=9764 RepID=A0AB34I765_ESCRO|nr:hypothetical protein J1605_001534 [Eschrichtius robustus]
MEDSGRAHTKVSFPELLLPVSLPSWLGSLTWGSEPSLQWVDFYATTFQERGFGNTVRLYTYSQAAKEQTKTSTRLLRVITVSKGSTMTAYGDREGRAVRSLCEIPAANE